MFKCDKIQDNSFTPDKVLNNLIHGSHELQTFKNRSIFLSHLVHVKSVQSPAHDKQMHTAGLGHFGT